MMPDFSKEPILALSWKAPYAQLMLRDKIETRTWPTKYRGWVLICCSKTAYNTQSLINIAGTEQFNRIMNIHPSILNYQPYLGMAIAVGKLVDCRPMRIQDEDACFVQYIDPWVEVKKLANGTVKQKQKQLWCHVYKQVIPLVTPFKFNGGQGWKHLSDNDIKNIEMDFFVKTCRDDYQAFLSEYNFSEAQVQAIVHNSMDLTRMPQQYSHNFYISPSKIHGSGFFAANSFQYGETIAVARIDSKRTQAGRYINHSCYPNACFAKWPTDSVSENADLVVVATKEIKCDEEVLIDYRQAGQVNGYKK